MPTTRRSGSQQLQTQAQEQLPAGRLTRRATRGGSSSAAMSQDGDFQPDQNGASGGEYNSGNYAAANGVYSYDYGAVQEGYANGGGAYGAEAGYGTISGAAAGGGSSRAVVKDSEDEDADGEAYEEEPSPPPPPAAGRRTRVVAPDSDESEYDSKPPVRKIAIKTGSGRVTSRPAQYASDDDDDEEDEVVRPPTRRLRRGGGYGGGKDDFVVNDEDDDDQDVGYGSRRSTRASANQAARSKRPRRKVDESYEGAEDSQETSEDDEELVLSSDADVVGDQPRKLREKAKIDYFAIPPLETSKSKDKGKHRKRDDNDPFAGLPHNLTGAQWAALYPEKGGQADSSDDDMPNFTSPRKAALFSSNAAAAAAGFGGGGMLGAGGGMDLSGGPGNLGKVTAALADTDPLGVSSSVSFDSVGGLGSHIQQLKEMVSLPLLYPEVFERFNITPPRGVLFHGPPGTGKTLLARALAASCSTEGQKISFFMRKGADCLSKWVGEAERQLRLLFEEAKKCQPSIIFFDEIDGLAPVRSSKQEQIHASIVSTLLALMDGMDGRGQVIVIGATNRPDAIDPALRRPGRFDREFYFPLPNLEGRRKIIDIHTGGWNPPIEDSFKDELAALTKGYGGADLRALCTEAALNAVQRTYPQIYKTNDRLLIKPENIDVTARDFVISQKNLIPSSARATSSNAVPLPPQLVPLLSSDFEKAKVALKRILPEVKKANVLEEAEFEDDGGGFEKEKMLQAFETLRVFRPRMLICGEPGMGQSYVGAAVLHHLEGFHMQSLDLATLVSDSTRTMEAACVQLFVEAKRHKPSIIFIPSLLTWCQSVSDAVKSTVKGLLDGLDPSDPILLLAVIDGPVSDLPSDVRSWFGFVKGNRVVMSNPSPTQRTDFFKDVIDGLQRPPNRFPDAMPKRKRVLEQLEVAPPPPPRAPTEAEIKAQEENDQRLLEYLKWKLGPILNELKKRYKRFQRSLYSDWKKDDLNFRMDQQKHGLEILGLGTQPYYNVDLDTMHMDLYKGYYHTPNDFLDDLTRIQINVEVNAILEHDAEAPMRAGQMINHSNVMVDQTFDAAFRAECAKLAERIKEREVNAPPGTKPRSRKTKGKDLPPAGSDFTAVAKAAAEAGGLYQLHPALAPAAGIGSGDAVDDAGQGDGADGDRGVKRVRADGEVEMAEADDQGPSKRARSVNGVIGAGQQDFGGSMVRQPSHSIAPDSSASVLPPPGSATIAGSTSSVPPYLQAQLFPTAAPMAVGAVPDGGLGNPLASTSTRNIFPGARAGSSTSSYDVKLGAISNAPSINTNAVAGPSSVHQARPPAFSSGSILDGDQVMTSANASPVRGAVTPERDVTPAAPEPLPDFVVSSLGVDALSGYLSTATDELNIDQLEQLRAACFDVLWRGRQAWDRSEMLAELNELAHEFVDEVGSL